ncbi:response regulator, partial [Clostridioides difficile]|nr:response regulator [Clostridioides difficile]
MINIIICEGKKSERVILNDYINTFFYNYNFEYNIKEFENGGDLLKKYPNNVDIIFMDIDLNDENGFNVSKEIKKFDESVRIIFVSSSNKYIKKGYEIGVYRYLEKP